MDLTDSVAAPDHKIRQCIQRSALFPGRADGGIEGPERFTGGVKRRSFTPEHRGRWVWGGAS